MDTRARTVREKLIAVAKHRDTVFYSGVARLADLPVRSRSLFQLLDEISTHEHEAGRPLLTAVVVRKEDGMSGQGFFKLATRLGHHREGEDRKRYWIWERDRVYAEWASD